MAKSRVAPLKATTTPRLELAAAVVATRLDQMVRSESEIQIDTSIFWTDRTCVLGYSNNDSRRFQTFVANRIVTIRESSSPFQWRYVTSDENPADDASRGLPAEDLIHNHRWLLGPEFSWKPEKFWPFQTAVPPAISGNDPEVKKRLQAYPTTSCSEVTGRWKQAQYLSDVFWRRWLKEYLPEMQRRQKWTKSQRNFAIGDIVLLVDENLP